LQIRNIVEKLSILTYPNVVGYSNQLMPRIRRGRVIHEEKCIRIYVKKKVAESMLKPSDVIPKTVKLDDGREVCTDVVEIGAVKALSAAQHDPKLRWRPSPAGVSTSRADERAAGTIGWFVVDEDGNVYAMSNNHVWAKENAGARGDPLVQPGVLDGGDPERDALFTLLDFVPINFAGVNTVDVAIATIVDFASVYMSVLNVGGVTGKRVPAEGERVRKMGRATGLTEMVVVDSSATLRVEFAAGLALFTDVIVAEGQVRAGDSGSPVLAEKGEFAGLLFAGSDHAGVVCKFTNIESELSRRLGRKVNILVANSYPPFLRETVVQVVQANHMALASLLAVMLTLLVPLKVAGLVYKEKSL